VTEEDPFTRLTSARNNVHAMEIRSLLEAEGIEVFVQGENHRALEGMLGVYVELFVMVRKSDIDDARELLEEAKYAEHIPAEEVAAEDVDDESIHRFVAQSPDENRPRVTGPRPIFAVVLAVLIPLGAGHFYVKKRVIGAVIGSLLLLDWILYIRGWNVTLAVVGLVAVDAIGAAITAKRMRALDSGSAQS
jgi:hypothetical protein